MLLIEQLNKESFSMSLPYAKINIDHEVIPQSKLNIDNKVRSRPCLKNKSCTKRNDRI